MSKDKLLSDGELKQECLKIVALQEYGTTPSNLSGEQLAKIGFASVDLYQFINTQKRLYAEMIIDIDTDVDIPEALKKIYNDGYSKGYNDRTYENSYNSDDFRMTEAIAPAVAKVRSRYDKQLKALEEK